MWFRLYQNCIVLSQTYHFVSDNRHHTVAAGLLLKPTVTHRHRTYDDTCRKRSMWTGDGFEYRKLFADL